MYQPLFISSKQVDDTHCFHSIHTVYATGIGPDPLIALTMVLT